MRDILSRTNSTRLTSQLDPQMFMTNTKLENLNYIFYAYGGIESINPQLFSDFNNPNIVSFDYTFSSCA